MSTGKRMGRNPFDKPRGAPENQKKKHADEADHHALRDALKESEKEDRIQQAGPSRTVFLTKLLIDLPAESFVFMLKLRMLARGLFEK